MRKDFVIVLCVAVALLVGSGTCWAQDLRIAVFDSMRFEQTSKRAQEMKLRLQHVYEDKARSLENQKKELEKMMADLRAQAMSPVMKEETKNQRMKEIRIKEMELGEAQKNAEASMQSEIRDFQMVLKRDLERILSKMRLEKRLTMILEAGFVLAREEGLDVTDDVVKIYDAEAGTARPAATKPAPAPVPPAGPTKPKKP